MPYVWNDHLSLVVNGHFTGSPPSNCSEEDLQQSLAVNGVQNVYVRSGFVVIRKLFVQVKVESSENSAFDVSAMIKSDFRRFGTIESIELLKNENNEVYVTYLHDSSAYLAIRAFDETESDKYTVQPANTWHQPMSGEEVYDQAKPSPIAALNEHCFIEIFGRCDLETHVQLNDVCPFFSGILDRYFFPKYKKLSIKMDWESRLEQVKIEDDKVVLECSLRKTRDYLRCIGPYVEELFVDWDGVSGLKLHRFYEKLVQYSSKSIKTLILSASISADNIKLLKPILAPVKHLTVTEMVGGDDKRLNLVDIFPNLSSLLVQNGFQNVQQFTPLPKLVALGFHKTNLQMLSMVFKAHPQVVGVLLLNANFNEMVDSITNDLPNLKVLHYDCQDAEISNGVSKLHKLRNLEHLCLVNVNGGDHLNETLDHIAKCSRLKSLGLHLTTMPMESSLMQRSLEVLTRKLSRIENLTFMNIEMDGTTIMDIIRFAPQLRSFHVHGIGRKAVFSLMKEIIEKTKDKSEPFSMCVDCFVPNNIAIDDDRCVQHFNAKCSHPEVEWIRNVCVFKVLP